MSKLFAILGIVALLGLGLYVQASAWTVVSLCLVVALVGAICQEGERGIGSWRNSHE